MEKIDLDAIKDQHFKDDIWLNQEDWDTVREYAKKCIQQALVLASEKATGMEYAGIKGEREGYFTVDKQSILDVINLVE